MKIYTLLALFIALLFCKQTTFAQADNIDSSTNALLEKYYKQLDKNETLHISDSIKKVELAQELSNTAATDLFKKKALKEQLDELEVKEQERLDESKNEFNLIKKTIKGFPVIGFFEDTLFLVYSNTGSISAQERSLLISNRIKLLGEHYTSDKDSITIFNFELGTEISAGNFILMSISDKDALWNNTTRYELASTYKDIITKSILEYKSEISLSTLAKESGLALCIVLSIIVLLIYINKFFKWIAAKILKSENSLLKGIQIKNYTLIDANRQKGFLVSIIMFVKWIVVFICIYITLPILFGIFPWTKNFAEILFGYILNPLKTIALNVWNYLPNLITILIIALIFRYVVKALHFLKKEIETGNLHVPGFHTDWANPTYQIVRVLLFAFLIVVIFPYLPGSNSPVFQGVSVFLGFLFTFGSAGSLSNIIAGLILTYMRLFKIGDRVKIGDVVGDVIEKSLLVTRIRTIKNEIISIPNSNIMNSHTINYSSEAPNQGLIIHTTVTIGYDVPWKDMHEALIVAASKTTYILEEPKPFVLQTSLDDFYVSYQINAYTREANKQAQIYSNLHQKIQDECNERGIEIMSPHYRAARDGNTTTIPSNYLPKDYKSPVFNVHVTNNTTDQK